MVTHFTLNPPSPIIKQNIVGVCSFFGFVMVLLWRAGGWMYFFKLGCPGPSSLSFGVSRQPYATGRDAAGSPMENSLNILQVGPIGRVAIITLTSLVLKFLPHALPPISPLGYMKNNILLCGGDSAVMRWWCSVFFSLLWTLKVPVNHGFWHLFTGTFLGTCAFFQKIHGQVIPFTGTFLDVFTLTFSGFTGKKNEIFTDTL